MPILSHRKKRRQHHQNDGFKQSVLQQPMMSHASLISKSQSPDTSCWSEVQYFPVSLSTCFQDSSENFHMILLSVLIVACHRSQPPGLTLLFCSSTNLLLPFSIRLLLLTSEPFCLYLGNRSFHQLPMIVVTKIYLVACGEDRREKTRIVT